MKKTIFITGTDTGVGKTVLAGLLTRYLHKRGVRLAALKPVCSGGRDDAMVLYEALGGTQPLEQINPWYFKAAIAPVLAARREGKKVRLAPVLAHIRGVRRCFDVTLVEGAGGLLSPMGEDFDSRSLIRELPAVPLIVAPNRLGVVNHILLTLEALPKNLRAETVVVLMGPQAGDLATHTNVALLEEALGRKTPVVPWLDSAGLQGHGRVKRVLNEVAKELGLV